jgi:integrase
VHARRNLSFLESSQPKVEITVRGPRGNITLTRTDAIIAWEIPLLTNRARLMPLLGVASALLLPAQSSRTKAIQRVVKLLSAFAAWLDLPLASLSGDLLIAFAVARVAPPVGIELPDGWAAHPVLPSTVKSEIGAMRSAAKLGVAATTPLMHALSSPRLSLFLKAIGANVPRLKSLKKPMLFSKVEAFCSPILRRASATLDNREPIDQSLQCAVRDAFAIVLCFATGARCGELLNLEGRDVQLETIDNREFVEVTFRDTKTRRTPLGTHDPFVSVAAHELVIKLFKAFDVIVGWQEDGKVWTAQRGSTHDPLSRSWFADLVHSIDPLCVPHSLRVGMATELWAANATIEQIMTAGRWTSASAVLYIIGSIDRALAAADLLGNGKLAYDGARLRQRGLRAELAAPSGLKVSQWSRLLTPAA